MSRTFHYESRKYSAILLRKGEGDHIGEIESILFSGSFSEKKEIVAGQDGRVIHAHYYSPQPFQRVETEEIPMMRQNGSEVYPYDMFIIESNIKNKTYALIAYPYRSQARKILSEEKDDISLQTNVLRSGFKFAKINLDSLLQYIIDGDNLGGGIRLSSLRLQVSGDQNISKLRFTGKRGGSIQKSKLYRYTNEQMETVGLESQVRRSRVVHGEGAMRISVKSDVYGNLSFYIGQEKSNLASRLNPLIKYLVVRNLLNYTTVNPLARIENRDET